jgi:hypothetical protein
MNGRLAGASSQGKQGHLAHTKWANPKGVSRAPTCDPVMRHNTQKNEQWYLRIELDVRWGGGAGRLEPNLTFLGDAELQLQRLRDA